MKKEHEKIVDLIREYLENHPDQRFGQAIFNLGINEFKKTIDPRNPSYEIRNIHNDNDLEIIKRIEKQLEWYELQKKVNEGVSKIIGLKGMTVNERLFKTDLLESFDKYKKTNKDYAKYILKTLKVDTESIELILNKKL